MTDFIERELVISTNKPGDGWMGDRPKPRYHIASYYYAWDYVKHYNKKITAKNEHINKKHGLDIILPTLKINFCMSQRLTVNAYGTYEASNGCTVWNGVITIDNYKIGDDWDQTKETIRHEICHAIHHQIYCVGHCGGHNNLWIEIAKRHNVRTKYYETHLV